MSNPIINGAAQIGSLVAPSLSATWTIVEKTSVADFLGGKAVIYRRHDTQKFHGDFTLPLPDPEPVEGKEIDTEAAGKHALRISQPLHHCESLALAQLEMEKLIREHMSKSHPELLDQQKSAEIAAVVAAAPEDPF